MKTDIEKNWDQVGPMLLMRDAGPSSCKRVHLYCTYAEVKLGSHGPSLIVNRNKDGMVSCFSILTVLSKGKHILFSTQGSHAEHCPFTLSLGHAFAAQRSLT
jgi:hypothetical protein